MSFHNLKLLIFNELIFSLFLFLLSYIIYDSVRFIDFEKNYFKFKNFWEKIESIIILLLVGLLPIFWIFYRRLSNFGEVFDLYSWYIEKKIVYLNSSIFSIILDFFFLLSILSVILSIFVVLKKIFYIHLMKVHIFLLKNEYSVKRLDVVDYESEKFFGYFNIVKKYIMLINIWEELLYYFLKPFITAFWGEEKEEDLSSFFQGKHAKIKFFISVQASNYFIYIILFSFFYDFLLNNMYITKVFVIFPFAFLYYLIFALKRFFNDALEYKLLISSYYYLNNGILISEGQYIYSNGLIVTDYWIESAFEHLLMNFRNLIK